MTDSMKFGPEWYVTYIAKTEPHSIMFIIFIFVTFILRRLRKVASGDNCNTGSGSGGTTSLSTPRYQLAEHRYGREEMLALFDRNCKPSEPLTTFPALYVEKTQLPLALTTMTEDETVTRHI